MRRVNLSYSQPIKLADLTLSTCTECREVRELRISGVGPSHRSRFLELIKTCAASGDENDLNND